MENKQERRKNKRIKDNILVLFESATHKFYEKELECVDLSIGGMQVISDDMFAIGQAVTCKLGVLTDVIPLEIQAKVVSVREKQKGGRKGYAVGLEFIHNERLTSDRLKDYIHRKSIMSTGEEWHG